MKTNKNGVKLLAIIAVFAMAFAGVTIIATDDEADADTTKVAKIGGTEFATLDAAIGEVTDGQEIILLTDCTIENNINKTNVSFTINGTDAKYNITLNKIIDITMSDGKTITFKNIEIVNTDTNTGGENPKSQSNEFQLEGGSIAMIDCAFIGDSKVEYGMTLEANSVGGTFTNVDFNGKVLGTPAGGFRNQVVTITNCQDVRMNYVAKTSNIIVKIGTAAAEGVNLIMDKTSATNTTLNFASAEGGTITFDLNGNDYTFKNITERKAANVAGVKLTVQNGTLTNTTFGVYFGDLDDPTPADVYRKSIVNLYNLTLAGKTVVGAGTAAEDYATITGTAKFAKSAYIEFDRNAQAVGLTVTGYDNSSAVTFDKVTSGAGKLRISDGSIVIGGDFTVGSGGSITVTGGDATLTTSVNNIVVNGGKLTIPEGVTVEKITGTAVNVEIYGTVKKIAGTSAAPVVVVGPGVTVPDNDSGVAFTASSSVSTGDAFGMSADLESDYTVVSQAFLKDNLTIPEGVTLTIKGVLDLNGKNLTVLGKLVVEKDGKIIGDLNSGAPTNKIDLIKTGEIVNNGTIGYVSYVKITGGSASVVMKDVAGISFSLTKEGGIYALTVSGTAVKSGTAYKLAITNAYITDLEIKDLAKNGATYYVTITGSKVLKNGSLIIGSKAAAENVSITLLSGAVLTIDGELKKTSTSTITLYNGSTAIVNGSADGVEFSALTGEYKTYYNDTKVNLDTANSSIYANIGYTSTTSKVVLTNVKGVIIDVTSKTYTKTDMLSYTLQMLNISGEADFINKDAATTNIAITKDVYIPSGEKLVLGDGMGLTTSSGNTIVTEGVLSMVNTTTAFYKGSSYSVKVMKETTGYDMYHYYTTFDDAFSNIASAYDQKVTVKGGYEFSKIYTVSKDQEIEFDTATISKDGKIVVEADGTVSNRFAASGIKGILIVNDGATCTPVTGSYEVSSKDAAGNITYTSAELAIETADAGDTIVISSSVEFSGSTSIPADVTVKVASGAVITANKDITVNGKLVNNGSVAVTGNLLVNGEVENNNSFNVTGASSEATVKGIYTGELSVTSNKINAAKYTDEDGKVYTNIAGAMDAVAKMSTPVDIEVTGKVYETSDITLVEGMKLLIKGEVSITSITLVSGSALDNQGTLTADVIASVGKVDTTGALSESTVTFTKVQGGYLSVTYNEATTTYTMFMKDFTAGTATIAAGTVTVDSSVSAFTLTADKVLKISEGATLVINKDAFTINATSSSYSYLSNAGTISLKKSASVSNATLGGEVVVALGKQITIADSKITGTITLVTKEGKDPAYATIDGKVTIGSAPKTLGASAGISGKVLFNDTEAYVVVFNGNTFESTVEDVKSTSFNVNGVDLMKVYAGNGNVVKNSVVNTIVKGLRDLDIENASDIKWKSGTKDVTESYIGAYGSVSTEAKYQTVPLKVSAAPGLIVYIDDIVATNEGYQVGTHTVTVYIDLGYAGTPVITFNGQKITDGKIVITSDMIGQNNLLVVTGATPAVTPTPTPTPIQPSTGFDVYAKAVDGKVQVRAISDDGYFENGVLTITLSYTYYDDFAGDYMTDYVDVPYEYISDEETVDFTYELEIPTDFAYYAASAVFVSGDLKDETGAIFI